MARHALHDPLWRVGVLNLAGDERIKAENFAIAERNIGLRRICLLRLQCVASEKAVKL